MRMQEPGLLPVAFPLQWCYSSRDNVANGRCNRSHFGYLVWLTRATANSARVARCALISCSLSVCPPNNLLNLRRTIPSRTRIFECISYLPSCDGWRLLSSPIAMLRGSSKSIQGLLAETRIMSWNGDNISRHNWSALSCGSVCQIHAG